jgi:hypothetical protein
LVENEAKDDIFPENEESSDDEDYGFSASKLHSIYKQSKEVQQFTFHPSEVAVFDKNPMTGLKIEH